MTWTNPPTKVTELKTLLQASTSLTTAGITNYHYPYIDTEVDTLPAVVLGISNTKVQKLSPGEAGITGTLICDIYHATYTIGRLEQLAEDVAFDLCQWSGAHLTVEEVDVSPAVESEVGNVKQHLKITLTIMFQI
jgi:hypothetical protein